MVLQQLVDDFVKMNQEGLVLELCEKYYDDDVIMLNDGTVFAESMRESYEKQKSFVDAIAEFDVRLLSKSVRDNVAELTFRYRMTGSDASVTEFTGKHVQTWVNGKIVREEYFSIEEK
jgi:hypothetical protein